MDEYEDRTASGACLYFVTAGRPAKRKPASPAKRGERKRTDVAIWTSYITGWQDNSAGRVLRSKSGGVNIGTTGLGSIGCSIFQYDRPGSF